MRSALAAISCHTSPWSERRAPDVYSDAVT